MEKKLGLKHLAPYLPCRLQVFGNDETLNMDGLIISINKNECITNHFTRNTLLSEIKPILRPLSDLDKGIEVNGKKFIPIERLYEYLFFNDVLEGLLRNGNVDQLSYWIVDLLFEWHFDVFGLIEKGLAVDANEIKI